jgi:CRISPR-associated protein, Csx7 family
MDEETPICADLDQIRTIVKVSGTLMNETPLRIGKGKEQSFVDPSDNPL